MKLQQITTFIRRSGARPEPERRICCSFIKGIWLGFVPQPNLLLFPINSRLPDRAPVFSWRSRQIPTPYTSGCGVLLCRETSYYFLTAVGGSKVLQGLWFRD
ncbi:MAG: hypothetical protein F6J93_40395 [Oscillatoria sp. SIO1A7]|nr:hypothetical protein [Oscillatoria sp. SIO1A7]